MAENNNSNDDLILVNIMEEMVKYKVRASLKELGACQCETCYLNTCALALNMLEPKYVTTPKGALFVKINEAELSNSVTILVAVTKAVMQIKENPRH